MNKLSLYLIIGTITINCLGCSKKSESTDNILEEVQDNEILEFQDDDSKSLLDIMDSIAASIASEQEIDNPKKERNDEEIEYILVKNHRYDLKYGIKPPKIKIAGHWGKEIITGNFIGNKIDTIWLEEYQYEYDGIVYPKYIAKSNIPNFPEIDMYWRGGGTAYLINEGDLDGDGKDELGWMIGNHIGNADLEYHIVHYNKKGYWEELVNEDGDPYVFSGDERHSGTDFCSKGLRKGTITISHYYWPEEPGSQREVKGTIGKPIWKKI